MSEHNQSFRIVIGMPGSGKTTYLKKLLAEGVIDCYFDDYQKGAPKPDSSHSGLNPTSDPRLSPNYGALKEAVSTGKNVAIADIRYCLPEEETLVKEFAAHEFPEVAVIVTYFANNPDACRHNVRLRNREEHLETELNHIDRMTSQYSPPQTEVVPVIMG